MAHTTVCLFASGYPDGPLAQFNAIPPMGVQAWLSDGDTGYGHGHGWDGYHAGCEEFVEEGVETDTVRCV
jgi:hypothetical protein